MKKTLLALTAVAMFAGAANAQLVNGDFETGDFTGWTHSGDSGFTNVGGTINLTDPVSGSYHAVFGPQNGFSTISQAITGVNAGDVVTITFWLGNNPYESAASDAYSVDFAGSTIMSGTNVGVMPYTYFSFNLVSPVANPTLSFSFFNFPDWYMLDNVTATPAPGAAALLGLGGLAMGRRRRA